MLCITYCKVYVNLEILCKTALLVIMTVTTCALVVPQRNMVTSVCQHISHLYADFCSHDQVFEKIACHTMCNNDGSMKWYNMVPHEKKIVPWQGMLPGVRLGVHNFFLSTTIHMTIVRWTLFMVLLQELCSLSWWINFRGQRRAYFTVCQY